MRKLIQVHQTSMFVKADLSWAREKGNVKAEGDSTHQDDLDEVDEYLAFLS